MDIFEPQQLNIIASFICESVSDWEARYPLELSWTAKYYNSKKEKIVVDIIYFRGVLGPLELDESLAPAPYSTSFTGTTVSGVAKMDVVNGKLRIVQDPDVTINVEGLNVQMENLFGGEADGLAKVVLR